MGKEISKPTITKARATTICERIRANVGEVADLLFEFHDGLGWVTLGYATWKECCEQEFKHPTWWAKRQLRVAEIRKTLPPPPKPTHTQSGGKEGTNLSLATTEPVLKDAAVLELAKAPEEKREAVLEWAEEKADGKPITAKGIKEAIAEVAEAEPEEVEEPTLDDLMKSANSAIEEIARGIGASIKAIEANENPHLTHERAGRATTAIAQLKSAQSTIRAAKGAGPCPYCDGKGCSKVCYGTGWANKITIESAPEK